MKLFTVMMGSMGLVGGLLGVAGAAPLAHQPTVIWEAPAQTAASLVGNSASQQSQQGGIVNERSTGNEPFMGPGASGGPTHSAPGATENTIKQQSGAMNQGGSPSDKSGGQTAMQDRPSESNPVTQQELERNAEQGGGAAVAAENLKEEDNGTSKTSK